MHALLVGPGGEQALRRMLTDELVLPPGRRLFEEGEGRFAAAQRKEKLPLMVAPVVAAIMIRWMFNDQFGVVNVVLEAVGLPGQPWLAQRWTAFSVILMADIWLWTPWFALLLLAGLLAALVACAPSQTMLTEQAAELPPGAQAAACMQSTMTPAFTHRSSEKACAAGAPPSTTRVVSRRVARERLLCEDEGRLRLVLDMGATSWVLC